MQLNLSNITYRYPLAAEPILHGITATFPAAWTGIVGDNGSGKTTLALIACGLLQADAGSVSPSLFARYCPQDATRAPNELDDFAHAYDATALRLKRDLHIDDEWFSRYETLSGGQQKRVQLGCAIWAQPDVLAVDEPTNHVDATTRQAIISALSAFRGVGLLVSHDRALLDTLCSQCLFVSDGSILMRPGTYSQAASQANRERTSTIHARETARKEKARIEREAIRRREEASRSAGKRSLKGIDKHDTDARHKKRLAVVSGQDGKAAKLSSRMNKRLADVAGRLDATRVEKRYDADIWLEVTPSKKKLLVRMDESSISFGDHFSLRVPALYIAHTDHIALVGDNGSGKTTLIHRLCTAVPHDRRMLYIPQEPTDIQRAATLTALAELSPDRRGRVLAIVAQLNSEPERILEAGELSPGELRKLMLALGILDAPELVVMDEPTNHLDLTSTEALERVLAAYPGALLLVSHDATLVQAATNICWSIKEDAPGSYILSIR